MPKDTAATASSSGSGADAAGGEAIYSSDGLPPLPAPVPPVASSGATDDADNVLDSDHVSPAAAFEVFGGKAYLRPGGGGGRSVATGNLVAGSSSGTRTGLSVEPPLVRLARLSAELSELERDLETTTTSTSSTAAGAVSSEELTQLARELSSRLDVLSNQHGIVAGTGGNNNRTLSDNLTRLVREELAKASSSSSDTASAAAATSESGAGGIVYELYASSATGHVGPTSAASAASEASIAERLGRIERAVGSSNASAIVSTSAASGGESDSGSGRSVLERLEEAERMAGRVDAKALDAAAARAKVIRCVHVGLHAYSIAVRIIVIVCVWLFVACSILI